MINKTLKDIKPVLDEAKESLNAAKSLFEARHLNGYQIKTSHKPPLAKVFRGKAFSLIKN